MPQAHSAGTEDEDPLSPAPRPGTLLLAPLRSTAFQPQKMEKTDVQITQILSFEETDPLNLRFF